MASVHAICVSAERGTLKKEIPTARFLTNVGIDGDGHCGDWGRQVTLLAWESVIKSNQENNLTMGPGDFAENVTVEGLTGLNIQPGDQLLLMADKKRGIALVDPGEVYLPPDMFPAKEDDNGNSEN